MTIAKRREEVTNFISDTDLTAKIKTKLLAENSLNPTSIHVATNNGKVVLRGDVPSAIAQKRAVNIIHNIDGVNEVISILDIMDDYIQTRRHLN